MAEFLTGEYVHIKEHQRVVDELKRRTKALQEIGETLNVAGVPAHRDWECVQIARAAWPHLDTCQLKYDGFRCTCGLESQSNPEVPK